MLARRQACAGRCARELVTQPGVPVRSRHRPFHTASHTTPVRPAPAHSCTEVTRLSLTAAITTAFIERLLHTTPSRRLGQNLVPPSNNPVRKLLLSGLPREKPEPRDSACAPMGLTSAVWPSLDLVAVDGREVRDRVAFESYPLPVTVTVLCR